MVVRLWRDLDRRLRGQPDSVLTVLLALTALFGLWVAFFGPPALKATLILYWWFP